MATKISKPRYLCEECGHLVEDHAKPDSSTLHFLSPTPRCRYHWEAKYDDPCLCKGLLVVL